MKKTLVIHPSDETTDCLSVIYEKQKWNVVRDPGIDSKTLKNFIKYHDRIIMLGHGTPAGLLAGGYIGPANQWLRFHHFIIDDSFADVLREKETISIWCNSDDFFAAHDIPGLHTGMIISEVGEERYVFRKEYLNEEEMAKNMELFCGAFAKYIDLPPVEMRNKVLQEYVGNDPVTLYNRKNITVL